MTDGVLEKLSEPTYFSREPPNIFSYLNSMLKDVDVGYYPYLTDVNNMSKDLIEVLPLVGVGACAGVWRVCRRAWQCAASTPRAPAAHAHAPAHCQAVQALCDIGMTPRDVDNLPPAIGLFLLTIFSRCKAEPPVDWPVEAYNLVMREDLALQAEIAESIKSTSDYMECMYGFFYCIWLSDHRIYTCYTSN
ncbi:hypothetical protein O3G_MSEX000232 [Manduca sexta]|nr:hypothetical protein O3G_MSEX000232 [Manduca sexta]